MDMSQEKTAKAINDARFTETSGPTPEEAGPIKGIKPGEPSYMEEMAKKYGFTYEKAG
jgi:hypothetical protein